MKISKFLMPIVVLSTGLVPVVTISNCGGNPSPSQDVKVTSINIHGDPTVKVGSTIQLSASVEPVNATNPAVTWSTDSTTYGTISSSGLLTAIAPGNVIVTATAQDGSGVKGTKLITVVENEDVDTWEDYIFDRTFSLLCSGNGGTCRGTGWILADATPTDSTDYIYWVATNWHVQKGFEDVGSFPQNMFFSCDKSSSGITPITGYTAFGIGNYVKEDDSKFKQTGNVTTEQYDEKLQQTLTKTGPKGIDLHIAKANFSNMLSEPTSEPNVTAKKKLDKLNKLTAASKPITEFADATSDSTHFENKKLYTAGYPVKNGNSTWETHNLTSEGVTFNYENNKNIPVQNSFAHWAEYVTNPLTDCAPQYVCNNYNILASKSWMDGGASGSMLIGNFGTDSIPVWKVCGIYWGGWKVTHESKDYSWPSFSVMNSDYKDFISSYL